MLAGGACRWVSLQASFGSASFVPGIGPSPDKMLQGRLFSYPDTERPGLPVPAWVPAGPLAAACAAIRSRYQR